VKRDCLFGNFSKNLNFLKSFRSVKKASRRMPLKYKFDKTGATASESSIINNLGDKPTRYESANTSKKCEAGLRELNPLGGIKNRIYRCRQQALAFPEP
jgi:hypothetical protein